MFWIGSCIGIMENIYCLDGFTVEFFKFFWADMGYFILMS